MELLQIDKYKADFLSDFASEIFIDYYNDLIGHEQSVYMADLFLSPEAIEELIDKGAVFRMLMEEERPAGFTEYVKEIDRVFLSKLYVSKTERGKGLGRILFEDCRRYALENGIHKIYLTVNKYNTPSYEIYLHLGFKVIDAVVNDIGHGYVMDDYIMELEI
ncbi:MAG: GNAT family N-acetyltransferase [Erysipelotrichaceae bacterium]|nr:GNAT family N-acetyltransferase [Erysipelotrichaceae bacterium]